MQLNDTWLREWVRIESLSTITEQLTLAGIELESQTSIPDTDDNILTFKITPNRGDCLSVLGIAREIGALSNSPLLRLPSSIHAVKPSITRKMTVHNQETQACHFYAGRVIERIDGSRSLPLIIQQRLIHAGLRLVHPVVDILNYVMLELGQPMHAFDLDKLEGDLNIRFSKPGDSVHLLDDRKLNLSKPSLAIADDTGVVALAGVMGNLATSVSEQTQTIFLESAWFDPITVAATARGYGIHTDASARFERGVDTQIQLLALERATALIIEHCGGRAGPVSTIGTMPSARLAIVLRADRIKQILGLDIGSSEVERILESLGFSLAIMPGGWKVVPPSYRLDMSLEVDIVEEIGRVHGFDKLPAQRMVLALQSTALKDSVVSERRYNVALVDRAYHEVITYSFVSEKLQSWADPAIKPKALQNPLTASLAVMRSQVWPSLVETWMENRARQQDRLKLFEVGQRYRADGEQTVLAGLWAGALSHPNWSNAKRMVDFFDVKGDVEGLLALWGHEPSFEPFEHPALHPGKSAQIIISGKTVGFLGALHPAVQTQLDLSEPVFVFELTLSDLSAPLVRVKPISRFPSIRRDLALLVPEHIAVTDLVKTIREIAGDTLQSCWVFDVYQGQGVASGFKSIALGLILQHAERTLIEDEIEGCIARVLESLKATHGAALRS